MSDNLARHLFALATTSQRSYALAWQMQPGWGISCSSTPIHRLWTPCSQVNPQFYAFRWITLLLTQEFSFPDVMRLWDTLLSDPAGRSDCLLRLCIAMLTLVRQELLLVRDGHAACSVQQLWTTRAAVPNHYQQ